MPADLISTGEVAELLGVSPARVAALRRDRPDFPDPYFPPERGQRMYWRRRDVERWNENADRRPGRRWPKRPTRSTTP
jgi:hypothetical protein